MALTARRMSSRRSLDLLRLVRRGLASPFSEWRELARAQVALLGAQWTVLTRPVGGLVIERAREPGRATAFTSSPREERSRAARIARSVRRAATYGLFRPKCLVRSLAIVHLLERRGIAGALIRIGVRREGGRFLAHAWVERNGRILGDEPAYVAGFSPLVSMTPAAEAVLAQLRRNRV